MVDRKYRIMITDEQRSAIIGYWRMGAKTGEISAVTGINYYTIETIISNYEISLSLRN